MTDTEALEKARALNDAWASDREVAAALKRAYAEGMERGYNALHDEYCQHQPRILAEADKLEGK